MMLASMTFWEWAGAAILTVLGGLSGGAGLKLIGWLKEHLDRKARKTSYHAKALLEQADQICGIARAMLAVAEDKTGNSRAYSQASILWTISSTSSLLNVWLANAWVLHKRPQLLSLGESFQASLERLRLAAIRCHQADMRWRTALGLPDGTLIRATPSIPDETVERADRGKAAVLVSGAFESFLGEFQALHNALQPLVREYVSLPETVGEGKQ